MSPFSKNSSPAPFSPTQFPVLAGTTAFPDAESAWFWCLETAEAVHNGARLRAGMGAVSRPCEPVDIQNVVLRLARQQLLTDAHLRALCTFGQQQLRPRQHTDTWLWDQAMERMTPILQRKGIVQ